MIPLTYMPPVTAATGMAVNQPSQATALAAPIPQISAPPVNIMSNSLPSNTPSNTIYQPTILNQPKMDAIQQAPTDNSVVFLPGNLNILPTPPAMTQVITSAAGVGALAVVAYFLNEADYNTTETDNGSGPGSVTNTYGDGWSGKGYSKLSVNNGGITCYGFTLQYITTSTGLGSASGIATAAPTILIADLVSNRQIPRGIPPSVGSRNNQFIVGMQTIATQFTLNSQAQFSYNIPVDTTVTLTIMNIPFPQ